MVEDEIAHLAAEAAVASGTPVPNRAVAAAMALVAELEAMAEISPPRPSPEEAEFDRQLAQLAAMTPVGRR